MRIFIDKHIMGDHTKQARVYNTVDVVFWCWGSRLQDYPVSKKYLNKINICILLTGKTKKLY